jgi:Mg2+ and Co2+ transporter CorA
MKKQAQRATLLTVLAVIYLPLTLVTGIFGMNIKPIDSATTELWVCFIGLATIVSITAAGFFGYRYWRRRHDMREAEARKQENKMYKLA